MDKKKTLEALIDLRTEHMYNSHLYQGIQLAIEVVDKMPEDEDDCK